MENQVSKVYERLTEYIQNCNRQIDNLNSGIAQRIHYIYSTDLHKIGGYNDIYDYAKSLDISRKKTNYYLNVIERFYDYDIDKLYTHDFVYGLYRKHDNVRKYTYSQLKACLGLTDKEINDLDISENISVREIEKRKKELKVSSNSLPFSDCSGVPPDQSENEQPIFESYNDKIKNLNPFELGFIPEPSEYLYIFDGDNTMIKGLKNKRNINTALKHLRTEIEHNIDDSVCYAVVKIKRG